MSANARIQMRNGIKAAIEALPELAGVPIFTSKNGRIGETDQRFVNVYLNTGTIQRDTHSSKAFDAVLSVRLNSNVFEDVDDDLDQMAAPIEALFDADSTVGGVLSDIVPGDFAYGADDDTNYSYLTLNFGVDS